MTENESNPIELSSDEVAMVLEILEQKKVEWSKIWGDDGDWERLVYIEELGKYYETIYRDKQFIIIQTDSLHLLYIRSGKNLFRGTDKDSKIQKIFNEFLEQNRLKEKNKKEEDKKREEEQREKLKKQLLEDLK